MKGEPKGMSQEGKERREMRRIKIDPENERYRYIQKDGDSSDDKRK